MIQFEYPNGRRAELVKPVRSSFNLPRQGDFYLITVDPNGRQAEAGSPVAVFQREYLTSLLGYFLEANLTK